MDIVTKALQGMVMGHTNSETLADYLKISVDEAEKLMEDMERKGLIKENTEK